MDLCAGIILFAAVSCVSGVGLQTRQDYEDMWSGMSGIDSNSIDIFCAVFCHDQSVDDEIESALSDIHGRLIAMQASIDELNAKVTDGGEPPATRPEWIKKFPVFMVESSNEPYLFSKQEAQSQCEQAGGYLASYRQLEAAWNQGMDYCKCGWLEEGFAAYPIQFPRKGCAKNVAPGIRECTWQSTWNAWCIQGGYYN